jgi:hypothetical protein
MRWREFGLVVRAECWHSGDPSLVLGKKNKTHVGTNTFSLLRCERSLGDANAYARMMCLQTTL